MRITRQILATAAVGLFAFAAAPASAHAQQIDFNGAVAGCFTTGTSCTPATTPAPGPNGAPYTACDVGVVGLLCDQSSFIQGATNGLGFSNGISFGGTSTSGSFGSLSRTPSYTNTPGINLVLYFFFNTAANTITPPAIITNPAPTTVPAGITPSQASAVIVGHVVNNGGITSISFSNAACNNPNPPGAGACVDFQFIGGGHNPACGVASPGFPVDATPCVNNGPFAGTAEIEIDPINVPTGALGQAKLSGNIYVLASSPEPATLALFATGLVGLVPVVRYRRRKNVA
jgi:hypothetical protein